MKIKDIQIDESVTGLGNLVRRKKSQLLEKKVEKIPFKERGETEHKTERIFRGTKK